MQPEVVLTNIIEFFRDGGSATAGSRRSSRSSVAAPAGRHVEDLTGDDDDVHTGRLKVVNLEGKTRMISQKSCYPTMASLMKKKMYVIMLC